MSSQYPELEIEIIGIIADSHKPDGEPIVASNFGAARRQVLTRLGYACDKRSKAARVMSNMPAQGTFVRQDEDPKVWGFRSDNAARSRCKQLAKEIKDSSDTSTTSQLRDILSGLTASPAVTTV